MANDRCRKFPVAEFFQRRVGVFLTDTGDHADSAVECPEHFIFVNIAFGSEPVKDRRCAPRRNVNHRSKARRQDAGDVVDQSATCNVCKSADRDFLEQGEQRPDINPCRFEQMIQDGSALEIAQYVGFADLEDLADQGITVGVRPGTCHPDEHITVSNGAAVNDGLFLRDADAEPRQVIIPTGINARHFRRFATDKRGAGFQTPIRDARNNVLRDRRVEMACGEVIEKEKRFRALNHDVIDAHCDQINADAAVAIVSHREFEFRANPVGARHKNRTPKSIHRQFEQSGKTAWSGQYLRSPGFCDEGLYRFHKTITGINIDSGIAVSERCFTRH